MSRFIKASRAVLLFTLTVGFLFLTGCDTGGPDVQKSPAASEASETESKTDALFQKAKQALGDEIDLVRSPAPGTRIYRRPNGTHVLQLNRSVTNREDWQDQAVTQDEQYNPPAFIDTVVKYEYGGSVSFLLDNTSSLIGHHEGYDDAYDNEVLRRSLHYNGLDVIPNYSNIYNVGVQVDKSSPAFAQERTGTILINRFTGDAKSPTANTESHFKAINGNNYFKLTVSDNRKGSYLFPQENRGESSEIAEDIESVTSSGDDYFAIGVMAENESTNDTGLLTLIEDVTLYISYRVKASASLQSPADGAMPAPGDITFDWAGSGDPSPTYDIQVSTNSSFSNVIKNASNLSGSSKTFSGFNAGNQYFWRVRADNSVTSNPQWTSANSFTVEYNAPSVTIDGPYSVDVHESGQLTTTVNSGSGNFSYEWYQCFGDYYGCDFGDTVVGTNSYLYFSANTDYYSYVHHKVVVTDDATGKEGVDTFKTSVNTDDGGGYY